jgi:hypothetical protein
LIFDVLNVPARQQCPCVDYVAHVAHVGALREPPLETWLSETCDTGRPSQTAIRHETVDRRYPYPTPAGPEPVTSQDHVCRTCLRHGALHYPAEGQHVTVVQSIQSAVVMPKAVCA